MNQKTAIALGTFDGLHIGHISVLSTALGFDNMKPMVATFDEPPRRKAKNMNVPMLMQTKLKNERLIELGFCGVISLDFDKIHTQSPKEFLTKLCDDYNVGAISCGFNYRFGKNGEGDAAFISEFCREKGIVSVVCPEVLFSGNTVSSTFIRELIKNGDVSFANTLLKYPFTFFGEVIHGDSRGHKLGFPTINVPLDENLVVPKFGSYVSTVKVDGKLYKAATNVGIRPTFMADKPLSETYILDFNDDIYGKTVEISLISFIRAEQKFESAKELINAILGDCKETERKL